MLPQIDRSQAVSPRTASLSARTSATLPAARSSPPASTATNSDRPTVAAQNAARARLCCDWRNPTSKLLAAYGLPVSVFHRGFDAAAAHDIQNALATLGPPTQHHDVTGRLFARALIDGHATKFAAVMTLARHQVINLNEPLCTDSRASMLLEVVNKPDASRSGIDFPASEFIPVGTRVTSMVALGAHPDHPHFSGALPLEYAWQHASPAGDEAAQALLNAGANPLKESSDGMTMLHRAALGNHLHLIRKWRAAGLVEDPSTSGFGVTPLMLAAHNNHPEAIRLLLANSNANIDHTGDGSDTALHLAVRSNSLAAAEVLLAGGASVIASALSGTTPYSLALKQEMHTGDRRMATLLQNHAVASGIPDGVLCFAANLRH